MVTPDPKGIDLVRGCLSALLDVQGEYGGGAC